MEIIIIIMAWIAVIWFCVRLARFGDDESYSDRVERERDRRELR